MASGHWTSERRLTVGRLAGQLAGWRVLPDAARTADVAPQSTNGGRLARWHVGAVLARCCRSHGGPASWRNSSCLASRGAAVERAEHEWRRASLQEECHSLPWKQRLDLRSGELVSRLRFSSLARSWLFRADAQAVPLTPASAGPMQVSPFLLMAEDWIDKDGGFEMHPHRGFETLTICLEGKRPDACATIGSPWSSPVATASEGHDAERSCLPRPRTLLRSPRPHPNLDSSLLRWASRARRWPSPQGQQRRAGNPRMR